MRYLSTFSGIEAASVAWHPLGFEPVGFSEIEPFPCAVLRHRFPNVINYGDITKYAEWPIQPGSVDILVGGSPCQSFSVAGLRKGLADPRGNLALVFLGLAERLKPRWIVWENVPGVLNSNGGRDFGAFLGALSQLGYGFAYRVLDAQHFGVPQRRRRVFLVGHLGDWRPAAEVLFESPSLFGHFEKSPPKRETTATDAGSRPAEQGRGTWWDGGQTSQCIDASVWRGQAMPEKNRFPVVIDRAAFNQGENAMYEPHIEQTETMDSLVARGPHAVAYRKSKRAQSNQDDESWVEANVANTLNVFDEGDTRTTHAIVEPLMFKVRTQGHYTGQNGGKKKEGGGGAGAIWSDKPYALTTETDQWLHNDMTVRRLSPKECERLQGFPDDWTKIPWKKKGVDECPDGLRYRACGNSMAVCVMSWIGKRLKNVDERLKV